MFTHKIVTVLFLIDLVISLTDVNLNNVPLETASLLLKTLSNFGNDVKYVQIEPNIREKGSKNHNVKTQFKNSISFNDYAAENKKIVKPNELHKLLIKRLIPHGLSLSTVEFDAKFKSFYKPLVRVHKRKPIPKIGTILSIGNDNSLDKYGIDVNDYYDNDENVINFVKTKELDNLKSFNVKVLDENADINEALVQPFIFNGLGNYKVKEDYASHLQVLRNIKELMKNNRSVASKIKTYDHVKKMLDEMEILRSQDKSGEDDNPVLPGAPLQDEDATAKPKKYVPHYPPWNYWTYNKSIHQDMCPLGQVKIANRCIWYPPH